MMTGGDQGGPRQYPGGDLDGPAGLSGEVTRGQQGHLDPYMAVFLLAYNIKAVTDEFLRLLMGVKATINPARKLIRDHQGLAVSE
jgi:hypothetical protein